MNPHRESPPAPALRLFTADDEAAPRSPIAAPGDRGLHPGLTLRQFFDAWFLPIVLVDEREDSPATILLYRDCLRWWERLTENPPLERIDEFTVAGFREALKHATYQRGKLATSKKFPLSNFTRNKILRMTRAMLYRIGPTTDPARPAKSLVAAAPRVTINRAYQRRPRPPFAVADAKRILAACGQLPATVKTPSPALEPKFWRAFCLTLYYTGLRAGTLMRLRWAHLEERASGLWLAVPEECVPKTHKAHDQFLHPLAYEALHAARGQSTADKLLFAPACYDWLAEVHLRLCALAGLPEHRRQRPQAWRRTHAVELAKLGARRGIEAARLALDHGDVSTTREFYCDIQPELIKLLPRIDERPADDRQLQLF